MAKINTIVKYKGQEYIAVTAVPGSFDSCRYCVAGMNNDSDLCQHLKNYSCYDSRCYMRLVWQKND